jgi:small GTP-binding protein
MIAADFKNSFKFVVVGSSGVGKTALLQRLVDDNFSADGGPTVGVEYISSGFDIDGSSVKLQIWDTAGQEKFRSIARSYFRHAVGVILVFSLADRQSFDDLATWLSDVQQYCDPNASVTLVGNKLDLASERAVLASEAQQFALSHHLTYIEASARDGENVAEAFFRAARSVYEKARLGTLAGGARAGPPHVAQRSGGADGSCC